MTEKNSDDTHTIPSPDARKSGRRAGAGSAPRSIGSAVAGGDVTAKPQRAATAALIAAVSAGTTSNASPTNP
jgi:hypothetical protein